MPPGLQYATTKLSGPESPRSLRPRLWSGHPIYRKYFLRYVGIDELEMVFNTPGIACKYTRKPISEAGAACLRSEAESKSYLICAPKSPRPTVPIDLYSIRAPGLARSALGE